MKKLIFVAFIACITGLAVYVSKNKENNPENATGFYLMNVEALSEGETLVDLCNAYCTTDYRYNCLLYTNIGTITCLNSRQSYY